MKNYKFYVIVREDTDEYFCFDNYDDFTCKYGIRNAFFFEEKEEADQYLKEWNDGDYDDKELWSVKEVSITIK